MEVLLIGAENLQMLKAFVFFLLCFGSLLQPSAETKEKSASKQQFLLFIFLLSLAFLLLCFFFLSTCYLSAFVIWVGWVHKHTVNLKLYFFKRVEDFTACRVQAGATGVLQCVLVCFAMFYSSLKKCWFVIWIPQIPKHFLVVVRNLLEKWARMNNCTSSQKPFSQARFLLQTSSNIEQADLWLGSLCRRRSL